MHHLLLRGRSHSITFCREHLLNKVTSIYTRVYYNAMDECSERLPPEELEESTYSTTSWAFVLIFVPLVAICGILCNIAFIFVVYRVKFMRSITNIYLVNLAIADSSLLRRQGPLMPDLPQVSLFIIYQNIKRFSIGSCNKILNR